MTDPADTSNVEATAPEADDVLRDGAPASDASAQGVAPSESNGAVEALQAEVASLKDRVLRTMAEMENLRRRTEREVADAKSYGVTSFAREMVSAVDNLQRAVASLPAEAKAEASPALQSFVQGIELTERDLLSRMARFKVQPIETVGTRFDPNRHEALFEMPDESVPTGTVVQQVETGYVIGERVLRPAKVGVSRGGPKPEAAQQG
nr:nucleotide exchange factor GrpE [Lichenibacterium sp. 6Y81]